MEKVSASRMAIERRTLLCPRLDIASISLTDTPLPLLTLMVLPYQPPMKVSIAMAMSATTENQARLLCP